MSDETSTATESAAPKATRHVPDLLNEILVGGPEENPVAQRYRRRQVWRTFKIAARCTNCGQAVHG